MITQYGKVVIRKDKNGEDDVLITEFTFDGKDIPGSSLYSLKIAALKWAKEVIDDNLDKLVKE
jgi:hypothetical protein